MSLLAAAKEKRVAAVVLIATLGITGAELVLAQQQRMLEPIEPAARPRSRRGSICRNAFNDAVITGKGWEALPPDVRRQVDTPSSRASSTLDPAKLDAARPPADPDRPGRARHAGGAGQRRPLEALARDRKQPAPVEVVKIPGVNHLLVPATTGEVDEYASLPDKHVSPAVSAAVAEWLKKTLQ